MKNGFSLIKVFRFFSIHVLCYTEQHLSSDSEPKTLPIERSYTMKVSFPFSKQVHSLTDEIRLAVDQTQSRMFDENSALRKKLTLYEQQAQRLESQFINISTAQSQV